MSSNANKMKTAILNLKTAEAKFYLLLLCQVLEEQNVPSEDPLWQNAQLIIEDLTTILNEQDKDRLAAHLEKLLKDYEELVKTSGISKYSRTIQRAVLVLCGYLTGFAVGTCLGFSMMCILAVKNIGNYELGDLTKYFLTGLMAGSIATTRFFESFQNQVHRQLFFSVGGLKTSFQTMLESLAIDENCVNLFETEREMILKELFPGDESQEQAIQQFLASQREYQLIGFKASFLSAKCKGYIGHHLTLVMKNIKPNAEPVIIELGSPSIKEIEQPDQVETRTCSGEDWVQMMTLNRLLQRQYTIAYKNLGRLMDYKGGENDCHTYINFLLSSVNQPFSNISRHTEQDNLIGRGICGALTRYGTFTTNPSVEIDTPNIPEPEQEQVCR